MAKISIIFNDAPLAEIIRRAKLTGKELPDNFIGPVFEHASIEPSGLGGMVLIKPDDADIAYIYNQSDISRIKIERTPDRVTDSGIVLVKPDLVTPKH